MRMILFYTCVAWPYHACHWTTHYPLEVRSSCQVWSWTEYFLFTLESIYNLISIPCLHFTDLNCLGHISDTWTPLGYRSPRRQLLKSKQENMFYWPDIVFIQFHIQLSSPISHYFWWGSSLQHSHWHLQVCSVLTRFLVSYRMSNLQDLGAKRPKVLLNFKTARHHR